MHKKFTYPPQENVDPNYEPRNYNPPSFTNKRDLKQQGKSDVSVSQYFVNVPPTDELQPHYDMLQ